MCKKLLPAVLLLGLSVLCMGQNQVPEISNVSVKVDPKSRTAFIKYDLADQEDDDLTVYLTVSEDNGKRYLVDTRRAQGDLGEGIAPGKDKKIVWEYGTFNAHISMIYFRIVADDGYRISVDDIMKEVEEDRIRDDLARLTLGQNHQTEEGHKGLYIVRDDIEKSYQTAGLDIQTQKFSFGGYNGKNIIGKKAGIANEKDNYIVFAHYDSREAKIGSVVNMSGIVGVLESMRILSKYNFKKSIRWAAFDLSYPEYMGSSFYVWKDGGFPKDENIEGGYFLNGIGSDIHQPGEFLDVFKIDERDQWLREEYKGNFVFAIGNTRSQDMVDKFRESIDKYKPEMKFSSKVVEGYGEKYYSIQNGDQSAFWYHKYKAIALTTWTGTRPISYPKDAKTYADAALVLNSTDAISKIVQVTIANIIEAAEIQHVGIYESSLMDHLRS